MKETILLVLLTVAAIGLTGCSTSSSIGQTTRSSDHEEGVPGGTFVETYTLDATVAEVNAAKREVILTTEKGKRETVPCGPEVVNFDRIEVGDRVRVTMHSELLVAMADPDNPPVEAGATQVLLAPVGAKPGGSVTEWQQYTATLTKIDLKRHRATLRFPDESIRTFDVRQDVDLSKRKVGEKVAIGVQVAVAISVEAP